MAPFIVGIQFQKIGKLYHFDASQINDLRPGDHVVVETSRGRQLGEVIQVYETPPPPPPDGGWKPVERRATPRDLVMRQLWQKKELEATINGRARLAETGIQGVKIITAEFSYDGSRLAFLYSSESADKPPDLNSLRSAMQRIYHRSRVEMRQIGPRDVAKLLGGMGACGLSSRCCSTFLTDFSPVSIKMAKEQGISLTPTEITGMCGRLRCCLVYEYEQYVEARKILPKRGKRVVTPRGEGKVLDVFPLKETVLVEIGEAGTRHEFPKNDLQPWDELEALRRKSEGPCDRHENGECDCGKGGAKAEAQAEAADTRPIPAAAEDVDRIDLDQMDLRPPGPPPGAAARSQPGALPRKKQHRDKGRPVQGRDSSPSGLPGGGRSEQRQPGAPKPPGPAGKGGKKRRPRRDHKPNP
jgi:cell fate regulator YaaT (PSP1 superfamily)